MAGLGIRIFTDEMITPRLARRLQRLGYDVLSCRAAGRANQRISDAEQLTYAAAQGRAVYTFNATDFDQLDREWSADRRAHAGIIVSEDLNANVPEMARRLQQHLDTVSPRVQHSRYLLLNR